jgi:hypothetical protein
MASGRARVGEPLRLSSVGLDVDNHFGYYHGGAVNQAVIFSVISGLAFCGRPLLTHESASRDCFIPRFRAASRTILEPEGI